MKICNWDLETGSAIDLTKVGTYNYAVHPSTRVHCLVYTFDAGKTMKVWNVCQSETLPADLDAAFDDPEVMFEGWNANFERVIFRDVLGIDIPIKRFRCTAARARSMALPGSLEMCGLALRAPIQKGNDAIMRRWMKPREDGTWETDGYRDLTRYCAIDVLSEIAIGELLRELSDEEWQDYWICEAMNDRGIPIDLDLAAAAQRYAAFELYEIRKRLSLLSDQAVTSPKQFQRIKDWLRMRLPEELQLKPDENGKITFDAATRERLLAPDLEDVIKRKTREFIQLIHDGGRASTAKFAAMQARAGADGRVRGAYVFCGAGQTHRFSSHGLQVHNFIRKKLPDVERVVEAILGGVPPSELIYIASRTPAGALVIEPGELEPIRQPYDVMTILSRCLRPAIVAEEGKQLVWGDWEQIEARVLPWLSKHDSAEELLDVFRRGEDVYRRQAALTYNSPADQVTKTQRQNGGKIPVLAFGFGGGAGAIMSMARAYGVRMDEKEAEKLKNKWRATNRWAPDFWNALERAAKRAVRNPGENFDAGRVTYRFEKDTLWCGLPSGRVLAYPFARIEMIESRTDKDAPPRSAVTCMKGSWHPKRGETEWPRMVLWGGIQAENVTQAEALSLLRYGARELHRGGWPLIGHTHDELLLEVDACEVDEAKAALHDIMTNVDSCFAGLPLAAEIQSGSVYGK